MPTKRATANMRCSVKFVQVGARQISALRRAFQLSDASLQAGNVGQQALHLCVKNINALMKRRVSF